MQAGLDAVATWYVYQPKVQSDFWWSMHLNSNRHLLLIKPIMLSARVEFVQKVFCV